MRCTVEEIAKQVGCSISTVSRVLNNSASVSSKARHAVLEAIKAAGAVPQVRGRRSRRKPAAMEASQSPASGLVEILVVRRGPMEAIEVRDGGANIGPLGSLSIDRFFSPAARYSNAYYRHIVDGAVDELNRFGHRAVLQVASSLSNPQLVAEVNEPANKGMLLLGDFGDDTERFLQKCRCPVVALTTWDRTGWPDYVGIDNVMGITQAFKHIYQLGHRKIGYVAGNQQSGVFRERLVAFRMNLAEVGLPYRPEWVVNDTSHIGKIEERAEQLLRQDDRPTAIVCCYDGAALAVGHAARRVGLQIPTDLSVTGFDDEEIGQLFSPPLTSVRVPTHEMGRRAVQLLMMRTQHYASDRSEACTLRVMPTLITRESTAAPK